MRQIFKSKGFEGELLHQVVAKITENEDHWVDLMMKYELEMIPDRRTSFAVAMATFSLFTGSLTTDANKSFHAISSTNCNRISGNRRT